MAKVADQFKGYIGVYCPNAIEKAWIEHGVSCHGPIISKIEFDDGSWIYHHGYELVAVSTQSEDDENLSPEEAFWYGFGPAIR